MSALPRPQAQPSAGVVVLADWRAADLERRRAILAEHAPSRVPGMFPGSDINQIGKDMRTLAKELRKGGCKAATAATVLGMMATGADLVALKVHGMEGHIHSLEKLLTKHSLPIPRVRKYRGPYKNRKPKR